MPFGVVVFTKKSQLPLSIIYIKQFSSIFYTKNVIKSNMSSRGDGKIKVFSIFAVDFKVNIEKTLIFPSPRDDIFDFITFFV